MSCELGEFVKAQGGFAFKSKDFGNEGTPVIKIANVTGGGFVDLSSYDCIKANLYPRLDDFLTEPDDVLIAMTGANVGKVVRVGKQQPVCALNQRVARLQLKEGCKYSKDFFYYLTSSKVGYEYFSSAAYGSAQPNISGSLIEALPIPNISPEIANKGASFLRGIDDKIHLNHQINQTLEQMAWAIFKSWFVDFELVKAKIAVLEDGGNEEDANLAAMQAISGKTLVELEQLKIQSPDHYQQLHTTAQHFPAAMQDSALGEIPEGWEIAKISDFGKVVCGKTPLKKNKEFYNGAIPFIKIPDTHGKIFITNTLENLSQAGHKSQQNKLLPAGSIGVSCIATVGQVFITTEPSHTNQQINSIILYKQKYSYYLFFKFKGMKDIFHDYASGGSATLNMNTSTFSGIFIEKPPVDLTFQFHSALAPLMDRILNNQKESETLESLRDALLPKLLSGELCVKNQVIA